MVDMKRSIHMTTRDSCSKMQRLKTVKDDKKTENIVVLLARLRELEFKILAALFYVSNSLHIFKTKQNKNKIE